MRASRFVQLGFTLTAVACQSTELVEQNGAEKGSVSARTQQVGGSRRATRDEHFADLVDQIPGFGGMYYDSTGTLTVFLKNPASVTLARSSVAAFLTAQVRGEATARRLGAIAAATGGMRARVAKYDFRELLNHYRTHITPLVSQVPEITMTDIDDATNRIVIGVESPSMVDGLRRRVGALDLPSDLIEVVHSPIPALQVRWTPTASAALRRRTTYNLSSDLRPAVPGGARIGGSADAGNWTATLGFNLTSSVENADPYFMTCSHCTNYPSGFPFQLTGAGLGQPTWSGVLGLEVVDPGLFTGGACPAGKACRYSDAALVVYHPTQVDYAATGQIAYPSTTGTTAFTATAAITEIEDVYVGQAVHKIGAWGGRTTGTVAQVCADETYPGSQGGIKLLCQS